MDKQHKLNYKNAEYGRIPTRLIENQNMNGIIYFVETIFKEKEEHNEIKSEIINMLESDSYNHGSEWRLTKSKTIIEDNSRSLKYILSLVSFRVKDSY